MIRIYSLLYRDSKNRAHNKVVDSITSQSNDSILWEANVGETENMSHVVVWGTMVHQCLLEKLLSRESYEDRLNK